MKETIKFLVKIFVGLLLITVWELGGHTFVLGFIGAAIGDQFVKNL